ncbi:hypothetical protein PAXRUDRAFT_170603, partial [Paxillus rubicundulus Ve08.2h10]
VTGLSSHHIGERFQHSPDTITRYFKQQLDFFSSLPFNTAQVHFPTPDTPVSAANHNDPQFWFFENCIGTVDGTNIQVFALLEEHVHMWNCKGLLSQDCLFICDMDFFFSHMCSMDGMDPLLRQHSRMMPSPMTYACLPANIFLQMWVLGLLILSLSHIGAWTIT